MAKLTHTDAKGKANMVDVGSKPDMHRTAVAEGFISLNPQTIELISENEIKKGDVLTTAEIAGIQAAKQTSLLIPLCHPLPITKVEVNTELESNPEIVNKDPYGEGWIIRIKVSDAAQLDELIDADAYKELIEA